VSCTNEPQVRANTELTQQQAVAGTKQLSGKIRNRGETERKKNWGTFTLSIQLSKSLEGDLVATWAIIEEKKSCSKNIGDEKLIGEEGRTPNHSSEEGTSHRGCLMGRGRRRGGGDVRGVPKANTAKSRDVGGKALGTPLPVR